MIRSDRLTEDELLVLDATGWGRRQGFGERPVLLIVDVTYGFTGESPLPVMEALREYPTSCGAPAWTAVEAIDRLARRAREAGIPVVYTKNSYRADGRDLGSWAWKLEPRAAACCGPVERANQIVEAIAPAASDIVIEKKKPSAFFGTPLASYLIDLHADQLIVVGCVTSGCVRATVVDAFSHNLRVAVVEEGTFDRIALSHEVALMEMDAKYADVVSLDDALAYLKGWRHEHTQD